MTYKRDMPKQAQEAMELCSKQNASQVTVASSAHHAQLDNSNMIIHSENAFLVSTSLKAHTTIKKQKVHQSVHTTVKSLVKWKKIQNALTWLMKNLKKLVAMNCFSSWCVFGASLPSSCM